jgi:MFS transporter, YNFM family, putative membrane transport protein
VPRAHRPNAHPTTLPIFAVVLAGAAAFLDLYATQPLLPFLARTFHASAFAVGLTITVPTVAVAICAPFVGRLADAVGLRKVILVAATLLTVATALAATARSLQALIFWRLIQGVLTPGVFASTVAYIHEVWPPARVGRATAAYVSGTVVGGFIGRAVTGVVAADVNWHAAFLALAMLNAIVAVALWRKLPDERMYARLHRAAHPPHPKGSLRHLMGNRRLVAAFAVGFCVLFTQVAMFTYVTFHAAAPPFNLGTIALGWLFAVYLVGAGITPFSGYVVDHYGHRAGISTAMAVAGVGALLTLLPSLVAIVAGLALCATGVFIAQATTSSFIGAVTTRDRGLAVGLYSACYYAGGSAGAALPALVWSRWGWSACVALVVLIQSLGAIIALTQWSAASTPHDLLLPEGGV